jgi:hypothetical protein
MVTSFASRLNRELALLSLPSAVLRSLDADAIKLGGLQVPPGLDPSVNAAIKESIGKAFIFGFRNVMLICVGLSLASATVAWLMIAQE